METLTPDEGISPEAARELLIAISQSTPDKVPLPTAELPKNSGHADVTELNGSSGAEDYRSRLISISDAQSPDTKFSPSPLEGLTAHSTDGDSVEANGGSGVEEYRSKLISISYTLSPDMKCLPLGSLAA